jgi:single-strand DNA-binding protein
MFNKVILIGNLTRDVELRYSSAGVAIAKFGLATNRSWKDRSTGEKRDETCFIDVNIFGKSAEIANQYLAKGRRVLIEGRLVFEQWTDQNGQKRSKHSVAAESFQFFDTKSEQQNSSGYQANNNYNQQNVANDTPVQQPSSSATSTNQSSIDIDDDDIPF